MSDQDFSLQDILRTLAKSKKYIIRTTLAAALLSAIISLLLPVYYKSMTSFYAASPDLGLPNAVGVSELDREVYGSDYDIDRILSIAESEAIYAFLIDSFSLYEHYNVDTSNAKAPYYVREELKDRYKVLKTKLGAIELTFEDTDPLIASNMANSARNKINEIGQSLMKNSQKQTVKAYQLNIDNQASAISMLSDSIQFYRKKYGIVDTRSQGEVFSELLAKAKAAYEGNKATFEYYNNNRESKDSLRKYRILTNTSEKKLSAINTQMDQFNEGVSKVQQLVIEYERLINQIAVDRQRDKLLRSALNSPFPALHIVEIASPPVIKSKPKRSLIVIGATFLAFILSSAFVLLGNNLKQINWKELWNA
jgi:uncharacterized protein involved in exopolysaccharide biosynthesis